MTAIDIATKLRIKRKLFFNTPKPSSTPGALNQAKEQKETFSSKQKLKSRGKLSSALSAAEKEAMQNKRMIMYLLFSSKQAIQDSYFFSVADGSWRMACFYA